MRNKLFPIFYDKLPIELSQILPEDGYCKMVTFLNPYYLESLDESKVSVYNQFHYICSDGIGPILMNRLFGKSKSFRISFDMSGGKDSSFAEKVFDYCIQNGKGVYFLGSDQQSIEKFVGVLKKEYPELMISGFHDGFFKGNESAVLEDVIASKPDVVIIGMGAPLQEEMCIRLKENDFLGTIYTCGGFFHQSTERLHYYPNWVDKLNLRAFYRIIHERGMIKRLVKTYPKFILEYAAFLINH